MAELTTEQKKALALASARKRAQQVAKTPVASGSILPMSRYPNGDVKFDHNAGVVGAVKRAVTLPGEVMRGDVPVRGADGNITDEVIGRAAEMGMVTAPMNPMARSGDLALPGVKRSISRVEPAVPTTKELLKAGGRSFDEMRATGAEYSVPAVQNMARNAKLTLEQSGQIPHVAKKTHRIIDSLINAPEGAVADIKGLHAARRAFNEVGGNFNKPTDQKAAIQAKALLDDFIKQQADGPDPAASAAARALEVGSGNYAAGKRSELIGGLLTSAERRAAAANSGQNIGNAIRSKVASALEQPKKISGYSQAEREALEGVNFGSKPANLTRDIGNQLGGSGGLAPAIGAGVGSAVGYQFGAPGYGAMAGAAIPAVGGRALKSISNNLTRRAFKNADELIRKRSTLYEELLRKSPIEAKGPTKTRALVQELLRQQLMVEQGIDPRRPILPPNGA